MKTVLVGGCFDLIHFGHVEFLQQAKACGDKLVVALEPDETVRRLKGKQRPIHTQEQRETMLRSIRYVDDVIMLPPLQNDQAYFDLVKSIHPTIIAITQGDPQEANKRKQAEIIGATLVVIPKIHTPSTSQLSKLLLLE